METTIDKEPGLRWSSSEFEQKLRRVGELKYHNKHPFHLLMHDGKLTRAQLQAWALNRYYYQSIIPQKDAIILSKSADPEFRRIWRKRIVDHDGEFAGVGESNRKVIAGGIEKWIRLAEATGLKRSDVVSLKGLLPGTRFAGNAYLDLVSQRSLLEAVASSLTEMFAVQLITLRMGRLKEIYPWLSSGLSYFEARITQAPEDASFALEYVKEHARTRQQQELCVQALSHKCDILWAMLDALHYAYVEPGHIPPDAFQP